MAAETLIDTYHKEENVMKTIPIWEKSNLTLEEAAAYFGIGVCKLREISDEEIDKYSLS